MTVRPLPRRHRLAVLGWLVIAIALWNGVFEMMIVRGVKEYLFRAALYDAGRGPLTPIRQIMDPAIFDATWIATLWTSIVLLAAFLTIRSMTRDGRGPDPDRDPQRDPSSVRL